MADRIRVMIVDDNEDTRLGTESLLELEDDIEIVGSAENGLEALERVNDLNPHVVLMDINMPVMDGLTATERLQVDAPRVQVIIVSVQDDTSYMRKAIRAGAVDVLAKPITPDELADAIRRAHERMPSEAVAPVGVPAGAPVVPGFDYGLPSSRGHLIGVVGPKGGVGKTTVAINLAVALMRSNPESRVLIVDGNINFGDVAVFLNTRSPYTVVDLALMSEEPEGFDRDLFDQAVGTHDTGVKLLVAPSSPPELGSFNASMVLNMFDALKSQFDYIIVDTSVNLDDVMAATLQSADRLILITTATMPSLKDARILMSELQAFEFEMKNVLLVLNRVQKSGRRITAEQITGFLKHSVALEIPEDSAADEALNRGVPLVTLDPRRVNSVKPLIELAIVLQESFAVVEEDPAAGEQSKGGFRLFG